MAAKIGLHACYFRGTKYENDVKNSILLAKQSGCEVFEVAMATIIDLTREERAEIKKYAQDLGMTLTTNGGVDVKTDISSEDSDVRAAGVEKLKNIIQAANEIGAELFCGINYTLWLSKPKQLLTYSEKQRFLEYSIDSVKKVIKTAEDCNIQYCFEIVNRYEEFLLNTAEEGVEFAKRVGSPNAKLLLDTFHMNIEEDNMFDAIRYAHQCGVLGHIHVGESNRRIPGVGASQIDWDSFFWTLKQIGYDKNIIMEPFVRMGLPTSMNCCVWRDLSQNHTLDAYMSDVAKGVSYLRSGLGPQQ